MAYDGPAGTGYSRYYYGAYGPYHTGTTRGDEEISREVRNRLVWDEWVDANQVDVEVDAGIVTLTGQVDSVVEKRAAGDDAWDTPGIRDVINNLEVRQNLMQR